MSDWKGHGLDVSGSDESLSTSFPIRERSLFKKRELYPVLPLSLFFLLSLSTGCEYTSIGNWRSSRSFRLTFSPLYREREISFLFFCGRTLSCSLLPTREASGVQPSPCHFHPVAVNAREEEGKKGVSTH